MMNRPPQGWGTGFQSSPRHAHPQPGQTGPRHRYPHPGQTGPTPRQRHPPDQAEPTPRHRPQPGQTGPMHKHPQRDHSGSGFPDMYHQSASQPEGPPDHSTNQMQSIFGLMSQADSGILKPNRSLRPGKGILKNKNEATQEVSDTSAEMPAFLTETGNEQMAGNRYAGRPFHDINTETNDSWKPQTRQMKGNHNVGRPFKGNNTDSTDSWKSQTQQMKGNRNVGRSFQGSNTESTDSWKPPTQQMTGNLNLGRPFQDRHTESTDSWKPQTQVDESSFKAPGASFERRKEQSSQMYNSQKHVPPMQQTGSRGPKGGDRHNKDLHAIDAIEEEYLNMKNHRGNFERNLGKHANETFRGEQYPFGKGNSNMEVSADLGSINENDIQRFVEEKKANNTQSVNSNMKSLLGPVHAGPNATSLLGPGPVEPSVTSLLGPGPLEPNATSLLGPGPMGVPPPLGFSSNSRLSQPMGFDKNMQGPRPMGSRMDTDDQKSVGSKEMNMDMRKPGLMNVDLNARGQRTPLNSNFMNSGVNKPMNAENRNLQEPMSSGIVGQNMVGYPAQSRVGGPMGNTMAGGTMSQSMAGGPMGQTMVAFPGQSMVGGLMSNSVAAGQMSHSMAGGLMAQSMAGDLMGRSIVGGSVQSMAGNMIGQSIVGGPGQPVFLQAAPVSIGYGGPTLTEQMSIGSMQVGPGYNDHGRSPPPGWQDRRSRSLSPQRYGSPNFMDDEMGSSGKGDDWLEVAIEETKARLASLRNQSSLPIGSEASGWRDIAIEETRKRLDLLERQSGLKERSDSDDWRLKAIAETKERIARLEKKVASSSHSRSRSRERSRNRNRGGLADRDRNKDRRRSRSRSRGRARDKKGFSRERMGSTGIADEVDPYFEGHEAYLEEQDRVWRDLKRTFKLSDDDKPRHPMFQEAATGRGYRCKDCKVTAMDPTAYGMHLASENHLRILQLRAQEVLLKESGDRRSRNRGRRSHSPIRGRRVGSLDRARRGGSRDRSRRSRSRDRAAGEKGSRERSLRGRSGDRDLRRGNRGPERKEKSKDKKPAGKDVKASMGEERLRLRGPVRVEGIHPTGCKLFWDSGGKKRKNATYNLDYRVVEPGKGDWQKLCEVSTRTHIIEDLVPGTTYKFRVRLERPGENYAPEFSEIVKTPRGVKVTIRNLGWSVTNEVLRELLRDYNIKSCKMEATPHNNQFAEIEVGTTEEAERCVAQFNNTTFRDRTLQVRCDTAMTKNEKKKILEDQQKANFEEELQRTNESFIENVVWEKSEERNGEKANETAIEVCFDDDTNGGKFKTNLDGNTEELHNQSVEEIFYDDQMVENSEGDIEGGSQNLSEKMEIAARKPEEVVVNEDGKKGNKFETIDLTVEFDGKSNDVKEVQKGKERESHKKDAKETKKSNQQEEVVDLTVEFDDGRKNEQAGETMMEASTEDEANKERDEERRKRTDEWKKRESKVLLYEKLKGNEAMPLIGLEYLTEIQDYNPETEPFYKCELCAREHVDPEDIISHCESLQHKLKYLEREEPFICKMLEWTTDRQEKREKVLEYAKTIHYEKGWGTVKLIMRENPIDFGRIAFSDTILLPPPEFVPPPEPTEEERQTALAERIYLPDGRIYYKFDQLLKEEQDRRRTKGENVMIAVGLKFVKEYIHPDKTDLPRYRCSLCEMNASQKNILPHINGKKHKVNYIEKEQPDIFKKIDEIEDKQERGKTIDFHAAQIQKKVGLESVEVVQSETTELWDWAKKAGQTTKLKQQQIQEPKEKENIIDTVDAVVAAAKETFEEVTEIAATNDNNPGQFGATGQFCVPAKEMFGESVTESEAINDNDKGQFGGITSEQPGDLDYDIDAIIADGTYMDVEESTVVPKKETFTTRGWIIENGIIQEKLKEGIIVKTKRGPLFNLKVKTVEKYKERTMIGLSWIMEYQREDTRKEVYYICSLCKSKISSKIIMQHLNSIGHRMNYMEKYHPDSDTLRQLKSNSVNKAERARILDKEVERFVREKKRGKVKVMLELDAPEEKLNAILDKVQKQTGEKKKGAKQGAEKAKPQEKGKTEKRKSIEASKSDRQLPQNMTICRKCSGNKYRWDPHPFRSCTLCCGCTAEKPCIHSRNLYKSRWKNIEKLRSESSLSNRKGLSSKTQTTGQQRFITSPRKGSSFKEQQVSRNKVTDNDFVDESSIERAVMHALHDVQRGVPGPESEISSLLSLPAPQRPPRPGTPPPPEVMGSPRSMNEPFIQRMGPSGLMHGDKQVLAPVGLPMNREYFDAPRQNVGNMMEPLQSGDRDSRIGLYVMPSGRIRGENRMTPERLEAVKNWRDQMQSGGTRGEKRRDFDQRSPDFAKRRRSFSPDRGGYDNERGFGDMAIGFDQGQDFDQDRDFDLVRGFDQDRDFKQNRGFDQDFDQDRGRYDDDDDDRRRQLNSPNRGRFDWDNDPHSPSYLEERYRDNAEWERIPRFDPPQYRDRSPDRDSDNGYRYLDDESPGRRSPTQEEIQELLSHANSRIPLQGQMVPEQMAPGQMVPGQMAPAQMAPGQMVRGHLLQGQQLIPGQLVPAHMMQGQLLQGQFMNSPSQMVMVNPFDEPVQDINRTDDRDDRPRRDSPQGGNRQDRGGNRQNRDGDRQNRGGDRQNRGRDRQNRDGDRSRNRDSNRGSGNQRNEDRKNETPRKWALRGKRFQNKVKGRKLQ